MSKPLRKCPQLVNLAQDPLSFRVVAEPQMLLRGCPNELGGVCWCGPHPAMSTATTCLIPQTCTWAASCRDPWWTRAKEAAGAAGVPGAQFAPREVNVPDAQGLRYIIQGTGQSGYPGEPNSECLPICWTIMLAASMHLQWHASHL